MKDMLMKKLMKAGESEMPEPEKLGKMEALKQLIAEMNELMGNDMDSEDESKPFSPQMQEVTVAAPDKKSLMKGLDKAEDVLEGMPGKDGMSMADDSDEDIY